MVVVNFVTKHAHFVSMVTTISAARATHLFLNHVWKHHGLPRRVVSDRGPQFVAEFTRELYRLLGIKLAAVRGRSTSSDVSSDISPSPLYIPPHHRQPKTECTRSSDTGVR